MSLCGRCHAQDVPVERVRQGQFPHNSLQTNSTPLSFEIARAQARTGTFENLCTGIVWDSVSRSVKVVLVPGAHPMCDCNVSSLRVSRHPPVFLQVLWCLIHISNFLPKSAGVATGNVGRRRRHPSSQGALPPQCKPLGTSATTTTVRGASSASAECVKSAGMASWSVSGLASENGSECGRHWQSTAEVRCLCEARTATLRCLCARTAMCCLPL